MLGHCEVAGNSILFFPLTTTLGEVNSLSLHSELKLVLCTTWLKHSVPVRLLRRIFVHPINSSICISDQSGENVKFLCEREMLQRSWLVVVHST